MQQPAPRVRGEGKGSLVSLALCYPSSSLNRRGWSALAIALLSTLSRWLEAKTEKNWREVCGLVFELPGMLTSPGSHFRLLVIH